MQWYLVQGRAFGDDDDTVAPYRAADEWDAIAQFRVQNGLSTDLDADAEEAGFIISVWLCGAVEPKCVI